MRGPGPEAWTMPPRQAGAGPWGQAAGVETEELGRSMKAGCRGERRRENSQTPLRSRHYLDRKMTLVGTHGDGEQPSLSRSGPITDTTVTRVGCKGSVGALPKRPPERQDSRGLKGQDPEAKPPGQPLWLCALRHTVSLFWVPSTVAPASWVSAGS